MKILIVIPSVGKVYGGTSQFVFELAQALGKLSIDVDIITTNANGKTNLEVPLNVWIEETHYRIQYFAYWGWSDYKVSRSMTQWLFQHITDYDLVHTNAIFSLPNLPAYWACKLRQVPYIVTPHGMLEPWALSYKAWKKRLFYALFEKPALNCANAIQMLASTEAEQVKLLGIKSPLAVVPNGIHHQDFAQLSEPELLYQQFPHTRNKKLILFLGRIDPKKGLDLLAKAFGKVYGQFPQTHLIVAGPDNIDFLPTAKNYFAEANCLDAVTFTGMLTGELKYAALAAASIYVAPSYSEGFSMSVLEGMASGLAAVITTGCNFPEAAQAGAAHVVNIDAEEIATALKNCLQHPEQTKAMGDRARKFIFEQYTWECIAVKLLDIYSAILQQKPIPVCH